jgi:hypothetical protein
MAGGVDRFMDPSQAFGLQADGVSAENQTDWREQLLVLS